eukprot:5894053-Amphidinium_carterae.2
MVSPEATCEFKTSYLALLMLSLTESWSLEFYNLLAIPSPVRSVCPSYVGLKLQVSAIPFWPVPRKKRGKTIAEDSVSEAVDNDFMMGWAAVLGVSSLETEDGGEEEVEDESTTDLPVPIEDAPLDPVLIVRALAASLDLSERTETATAATPDQAHIPPPPHPFVHASSSSSTQGADTVSKRARTSLQSVPKSSAETIVWFPDNMGKISYHHGRQSFEAVCLNPAHQPCVLTRTSKGRKAKKGTTVAGRPLGFLSAWLLHADLCSNKEEHWSKQWWTDTLTVKARTDARAELKTFTNGEKLVTYEREAEDGEDSEPETLAGLL